MNFLRSVKSIFAVVLALCLIFACGCGGSSDDTSSDASTTSGNNSTVASTESDTSSKDTVSRLTDDQIAMAQHLGKWSDKLTEVQTAVHGKFSFLVETDPHHYDLTAAEVGKNAAALSNFVELDFIANLGDLIRGYSQDEIDNDTNMRACMSDIFSRFTTRAKCPVFMTVGNHDTNIMWCQKWADHTMQIMPEDHVSMVYAPLKEYNGDKMVTGGNGSYYYMDFPNDKIRVVMLNQADDVYDGTKYTSCFKISDEQVEWFKTEALNTEYSVLVMSHVPLDANFTLAATGKTTNGVSNSDAIRNAVEEFVSGGGDFIAYLNGHEHEQIEYIDENGRLYMSFTNGGKNGEVVTIDTETRTISTIGLGNAKSRECRYN